MERAQYKSRAMSRLMDWIVPAFTTLAVLQGVVVCCASSLPRLSRSKDIIRISRGDTQPPGRKCIDGTRSGISTTRSSIETSVKSRKTEQTTKNVGSGSERNQV